MHGALQTAGCKQNSVPNQPKTREARSKSFPESILGPTSILRKSCSKLCPQTHENKDFLYIVWGIPLWPFEIADSTRSHTPGLP